jgi:hypothetical protein
MQLINVYVQVCMYVFMYECMFDNLRCTLVRKPVCMYVCVLDDPRHTSINAGVHVCTHAYLNI